MKTNNKAAFTFSGYFVFMFLAIALLGVFGGLTAALMYNYDVSTSEGFNTYLNTFDKDQYADQDTLEVDASDAGSDFGEYESSFQFFDQAKETKNQTQIFAEETGKVLGLPAEFWGVVVGIVFIFFLIAGVYFLRGLIEK